jgi:hypothetical protein
MTGPRFSLVIPTRNRPRTLAACLRSCLAQKFDDFEVVVSDNNSPPDTREVVLSAGDPRVKYFRTPADLAVTDSFEFAIEKATGEYVMMLGDDDGCLLHALAEIDRILKVVKTSALQWNPVLYTWPDIADHAHAAANTLVVPLRQTPQGCALERYDSRPMIEAAANGDISYAGLPMVYCCAAVHRDVFCQLRQRTGRVFRSRAPDVYVAFAGAHVAESYYSIAAPMTISGTSIASTGLAHLRSAGSETDRQYRRSSEQAGYAPHRLAPYLPALQATVADAALHFRDALAPGTVPLDRRRLVTSVLRDMVVDSEASWREALAACRRSLQDDEELLAWFDRTEAARPYSSDFAASRKHTGRRYGGTSMALDAAEHGVRDVYGAAELCERLLGYRRDGIAIVLREGPTALVESLSELEAKERVIQEKERTLQEMQKALRTMEEQLRRLDADARARAAKQLGRRLKRLIPPVFRNAVRSMRGR